MQFWAYIQVHVQTDTLSYEITWISYDSLRLCGAWRMFMHVQKGIQHENYDQLSYTSLIQ